VITLDVEMPKMNGAIPRHAADARAHAGGDDPRSQSAARVLRALELGAVEFVTKPS
jgi:chemotaxis response regulator CheB